MDTQSNLFRRLSAVDQGMMDSPHNTPTKVCIADARHEIRLPNLFGDLCFFACNIDAQTFA